MPDIDVEKELLEGMSIQLANDLDWVIANTRWVWDERTSRFTKWLLSQWPFSLKDDPYWFACRYGWGEWYCPPFPN